VLDLGRVDTRLILLFAALVTRVNRASSVFELHPRHTGIRARQPPMHIVPTKQHSSLPYGPFLLDILAGIGRPSYSGLTHWEGAVLGHPSSIPHA